MDARAQSILKRAMWSAYWNNENHRMYKIVPMHKSYMLEK